MAARVGTGVTGSGSGSASTIASATKNTTAGNALMVHGKWENAGVAVNASTVTDRAGNTYTILLSLQNLGGTAQPGTCLAYAKNIIAHTSNVVTLRLGANASFRNIIVEEFSGLDTTAPEDGSVQSSSAASGTTHTTPNITTSASGLVFMGFGLFNAVSGVNGTPGNPDFTVGATAGESAVGYLISASAQTVSPGMGNTTGDRWNAIAQAFKDAASGVTPARILMYGDLTGIGSPGRFFKDPLQ